MSEVVNIRTPVGVEQVWSRSGKSRSAGRRSRSVQTMTFPAIDLNLCPSNAKLIFKNGFKPPVRRPFRAMTAPDGDRAGVVRSLPAIILALR
jgi:hypothetical protein